jgi:hypothetical protein
MSSWHSAYLIKHTDYFTFYSMYTHFRVTVPIKLGGPPPTSTARRAGERITELWRPWVAMAPLPRSSTDKGFIISELILKRSRLEWGYRRSKQRLEAMKMMNYNKIVMVMIIINLMMVVKRKTLMMMMMIMIVLVMKTMGTKNLQHSS